jgi:hypothetical protein
MAWSTVAPAGLIFSNLCLTYRIDPGLIRVEMGAAINPVSWTSVSAGCGSPTGFRSEQACLLCACSVSDLAPRTRADGRVPAQSSRCRARLCAEPEIDLAQ